MDDRRELDARREKQLGNAVTVNVAEYIGHRIVRLEGFLRMHPELDPADDYADPAADLRAA